MSDYESFDEEDDDYGILKQALEVQLPENFDPNKIPQTGEEYLQHVIYERNNKCKSWITVDIDRSKFKNKQTLKIKTENSVETHLTLLPSKNWQNEKIEDFIKFRKFLQSQNIKESVISSFDETEFLYKINREAPKFSKITKYTQAAKIRMLEIITKYLDKLEEGSSMSKYLGIWLYAIFALLAIPLSPSYCFTLREFCKKCKLVRSKLPSNTDKSLCCPLNLCICIVARFFNQLDLSD